MNSLNRTAWSATLHCLTGCAIGEVIGMVIGTWLGWANAATVAVSTVLAFFFGYTLTIQPLLTAGMGFRLAAGLAFASDTASITVMEIVDNLVMVVIPGAMDTTPSRSTDGSFRAVAAMPSCTRITTSDSEHQPSSHRVRPSPARKGGAEIDLHLGAEPAGVRPLAGAD